ncbi:MAG TPA: DUF6256 family protein [Actinomycetota bacterium]|nr:DUF6256 family protein [Actinomycetota bacterium]
MESPGGGMWGGVIAPLASAYVGVVVMLLVYARSPKRERPAAGGRASWRTLLRHLLTMTVAGYLIFLAIVLVFSFMFADQPRAIRQALAEGALLAVIGFVVLAFLGWVEAIARRRPGDPPGGRPPRTG